MRYQFSDEESTSERSLTAEQTGVPEEISGKLSPKIDVTSEVKLTAPPIEPPDSSSAPTLFGQNAPALTAGYAV